MKLKIEKKTTLILLILYFITPFATSEENAYPIIKTPKNPLYGSYELKLRKDLIIGNESYDQYLFGSINGIEVNDRYMFVCDSKMVRIQVYDLKGRYVRTIGRKGNGPGEFLIPNTFCVSRNGNIYVHDVMRRRMIVFDQEGNHKRDITLEKILAGKFYVDENGYIYSSILEFESENDMYIYFIKMNPQGKLQNIFRKEFYLSPIFDTTSGNKMRIFYDHPYLANLYFTVTNGNTLVLMNSLVYELDFLSQDGKVLMKIAKDEKSEKVSEEEKEGVFSDRFKDTPKSVLKNVTFSKQRPYSSNILTDETGRIYVERFKPVTEEDKGYSYDIFNKKGEYLYRSKIGFIANLIKNGYLYNISVKEEAGEIRIIRYKIENWGEMRF
ncbi:MAG: 6-bladed beta-propeller [Acidobacteriota bacterium]